MPDHVVNEALYHDRTVQDWHRERFHHDAWAIDLDLMGACHMCADPLYLIEATTNPEKHTSIIHQLAKRSQVPALLIVHDQECVRYAEIVYPRPRTTLNSETALTDYIVTLRQEHESEQHPQWTTTKWCSRHHQDHN